MPSCQDYEGRLGRFGQHQIKPFNCESRFMGEQMYFGVFSKTGVNVRIGCSFGKDYFGAGQLFQAPGKTIKNTYETFVNRDEGDCIINDLISSKQMNSREYEHALITGKAHMLKEKRLMGTFMSHIDQVKDKQKQRLDSQTKARKENQLKVGERQY